MTLCVKFARAAFISLLVPILGGSGSEAVELAASKYFVRRGGVVCQKKSDILKIGRTLNTLRHFKQLRALLADGRCQTYPTRIAIIELKMAEPSTPVSPAQIKTQDKASESRWLLRADLGELAN